MKKILISSLISILVMLSMVGCSSSKTATQKSTSQTNTKSSTSIAAKDLTLTQLTKYNGKNGNAAYVAVDGTIYDVTNAKGWSNGEHKNGITAGKDLSKEIGNSPHGKDVLKNLPIIGKLK